MPAGRSRRDDLTEQQREKIVRLAEDGLSVHVLAERFSVNRTAIYKIVGKPAAGIVKRKKKRAEAMG